MYLAWPTPPSFRSGDGELDLAASVLTGGKTSRLYKRLVYDMRIAQSVDAHQDSRQLGSKFVIVATAQPGHTADELREAIDDELGRLSSGGVTEAELGRAKARALAGIVFDVEHDSERANLINLYGQLAHDPGFLPRDMDRYATASAAEVVDAVRRYLPLDRRVVVTVTPDKTAPVSGVLRGRHEVPSRLTAQDAPPSAPAAPVGAGAR